MRLRYQQRRKTGMTIIEMMVVMVIIALAMTGVVYGIGSLTRQKLKSSTVDIAAAVRMAYSRAATKGSTVRIIFDFEAQAFWAEEAEGGRVLLSRNDEELEEDQEEGEEGQGGQGSSSSSDLPNLNANDSGSQADLLSGFLGSDSSSLLSMAQGAAQSKLGGEMDFDMLGQLGDMGSKAAQDLSGTPRYKVPRFSPLPGKLGRPVKLEKGVILYSVMSSHRDSPADSGRASIYFFPGGITELAVVQLQDEDGYINSVEVHPLTGKCTIHDVPYEIPLQEDDRNEAREAF